MNKYCIVASSDFIDNKAGGAQVLESNINTILLKNDKLNVYFIDTRNRQIIRKEYVRADNKSAFSKILNYPSIGRFDATLLKFILFFYLALKSKFILVEHFYSLPNFKFTPGFIRNKIIYSHHDFLFEIKALRDKVNKDYLRKIELKTIKCCRAVICGNFMEKKTIEGLGLPALYLPLNTISKNIANENELDTTNIIFHLGSFNTTASRLGFVHFQNEILPNLNRNIKILLIGQDSEIYANKEQIIGLGFVYNLSDYLKKGSITIIPWKYGTGQRTRVFESISRGNIIISYKVLGEIIPELVSGKNCILVNNESQFAFEINNLFKDPIRRCKISEEAIQLSSQFSLENRSDIFENFFKLLN